MNDIGPILASAAAAVLFALSASALASQKPQKPEEIVAAVLIGEAGGEVKEGMQAVMEVIQTRSRTQIETRLWIVTRLGQFSCLNGITPAQLVRRSKRHPRWKEALMLAVLGTQTNHTKGANHYHESSLTPPPWANGQKVVARIGRHVFYKL